MYAQGCPCLFDSSFSVIVKHNAPKAPLLKLDCEDCFGTRGANSLSWILVSPFAVLHDFRRMRTFVTFDERNFE